MVIVAIKAPLVKRWKALAELTGRTLTREAYAYDNSQDMSDLIYALADEYFDKHLTLLGTWVENGWTVLWSIDGFEWLEESMPQKLQKLFRGDVWVFSAQTNTTPAGKEISHYLVSYAGDKKLRKFECLNGRITKDTGKKQKAEKDVDMSASYAEDDMDLLMENLGITYAPDDDLFRVLVFKDKKK